MTTVIAICLTCDQDGRSVAGIPHLWWCGKPDVSPYGAVQNITLREVQVKLCSHGRDVTLSGHECDDCSQAIAEARCPQM